MKHYLTFILMIVLSSFSWAKTEPVFPDIELPKSLSSIQQEIEKNNQAVLSKITKKDGKTIYYFGKENDKNEAPLLPNKENAFYYRVILGTTDKEECVVQDFFVKTNTKQAEPIIVSKNDCQNFSSFYNTTFGYDENNNLIDISIIKINNKIVTTIDYIKQSDEFSEYKQKIDFSNPNKVIYLSQWKPIEPLNINEQIEYNSPIYLKKELILDNKNMLYTRFMNGEVSNKFEKITIQSAFKNNQFLWQDKWYNRVYQKPKEKHIKHSNDIWDRDDIKFEKIDIDEIKKEIQFFKEKIK